MASIGVVIKTVSVYNSIPLYAEAPTRECYYSLDKLPIAGPKSFPAAAISTHKPAFEVDLGSTVKGDWVVKATLNGQTLTVKETEIPAGRGSFTAPITSSRPLPWSLIGKLDWYVRKKSETVWQEWQSTNLHLYVLAPSLPDYILKSGLSLDLLKQKSVFGDWMSHPVLDQGFAEFVIWALFTKYPIRYEITSGAAKYSAIWYIEESDSIKLHSWIDLWVSDMNGIRDRKQTQVTYSVNCYDLAVIAHTIISLGMPVSSLLGILFLEPFGYINKTTLIGQGLCNNAYFTKDEQRICDTNEHDRRPFENHVFLADKSHDGPKGPHIYDACCGPTYKKPLTEYLAEMIDSNSLNAERGKAEDVKVAKIEKLVKAISFKQPVAPPPSGNKALKTVFELVEDCFDSSRFIVESPYIGITRAGRTCATWAVIRKDEISYRLGINILYFPGINGAQEEYQRRKNWFPKLFQKEIGDNDMTCRLNNSAVHMFHAAKGSDQADQFNQASYLFSIEIDTAISGNLLTSVAGTLKAVVLGSILRAPKPVNEIGSIEAINAIKKTFPDEWLKNNKLAVKVGDYFQVRVTPRQEQSPYNIRWNAYDVSSDFGHVIRINSEMDNSGNALFTFLSRWPSGKNDEKITITLYGPQLSPSVSEISVVVL